MAPWFVAPLASVGFITWNARALCSYLPGLRKAKAKFLLDVLRPRSNVCNTIALQEVHGTPEKAKKLLYPILPHYKMFHSFTPAPDDSYKEDEGSVVTLVPKPPPGSPVVFESSAPVPGRVLRVVGKVGSYTWVHWNIHNYGLTSADVGHTRALLASDAAAVAADPFEFLHGCLR